MVFSVEVIASVSTPKPYYFGAGILNCETTCFGASPIMALNLETVASLVRIACADSPWFNIVTATENVLIGAV
jgi:hypothetical protein